MNKMKTDEIYKLFEELNDREKVKFQMKIKRYEINQK